MAKIRIAETGMSALDGEYGLNLDFTNRELHVIKKEAGVRAGEIEDALKARDNDVVVVFAYIALRQAGKNVPLDTLWDLPAGKLILDLREEDEKAEADAGPPASPPPSESGEPGSAVVRLPSSGSGSPPSSESPASDPSPTGDPTSETPSEDRASA